MLGYFIELCQVCQKKRKQSIEPALRNQLIEYSLAMGAGLDEEYVLQMTKLITDPRKVDPGSCRWNKKFGIGNDKVKIPLSKEGSAYPFYNKPHDGRMYYRKNGDVIYGVWENAGSTVKSADDVLMILRKWELRSKIIREKKELRSKIIREKEELRSKIIREKEELR
ncbi:MAG: hypothetical protein QNL04_10985, partial [SAR324 cluster bacterium]|nr:hypothetical protein [SAR324 cluster bacterium]